MRNLATIQKIDSIKSINGADNIECVTVLGWEVVTKKGEFKVNDLIIFIEIDSVVPDKPEFEFLRVRKFRVRTIKLKKQVSQGLVVPVTMLKDNPKFWTGPIGFFGKVGDDVTEALGIEKYLTPSEQDEEYQLQQAVKLEKSIFKKFLMRFAWYRRYINRNKIKGTFPSWISKTDEERIQNMPRVLEDFKNKVVYVTEKVDYQSVTFTGRMIPKYKILGKYSPKKYQFIVCSRNGINNDKNSLYWKIATKYNIESILKYNPTLTIQGEQGSTNVQGNKYGISEPTLWVFNIIDHETKHQFNYAELLNFCMKWGLTTVPFIEYYKLSELGSTVTELVEYSKGFSKINPKVKREGVVVRGFENDKKLFSFKVINPDFLLQYEN